MDWPEDWDIVVKPFFGGAAAYANSKICLSLTKIGFAVKLPAADRQILLQLEGAKPLQYFPNAPIKKEYVVLPQAEIDDSERLRHWILRAMNYVTGL